MRSDQTRVIKQNCTIATIALEFQKKTKSKLGREKNNFTKLFAQSQLKIILKKIFYKNVLMFNQNFSKFCQNIKLIQNYTIIFQSSIYKKK